MNIQAWTDYPFIFLGDEPHKLAPIREVVVSEYDGDKYCVISVEGVVTEVKRGYLYSEPGRCGDVPSVNLEEAPSE